MSITLDKYYVVNLNDSEMKYLLVVNLPEGVVTNIATSLIDEPYNIEFIDSSGNIITTELMTLVLTIEDGVYHVSVYNGGPALTSVKLKILY